MQSLDYLRRDKKEEWFEENGKLIDEVAGYDNKLMSLDDRIKQTPTTNLVTWSGERGKTYARPIDTDMQELLKKYGVKHIRYRKDGEPDFKPVSVAQIRIDDMTSSRNHNFSRADEVYAKRIGKTPKEIRELRKREGLTWHEDSDMEHMYLVKSKINAYFKHSGGVSECKQFEQSLLEMDKNQISLFNLQNLSAFGNTLKEKMNKAHEGGKEALKGATIPILVEAATDLVKISSGEMTLGEAALDVGKLSAKVYASGAITNIAKDCLEEFSKDISSDLLKEILSPENIGLIVGTASVILSTSYRYIQGDISVNQMFAELVNKGAALTINHMLFNPSSGLALLSSCGGAVALLGSMLVSSACSYIVSGIQSFNDYKKDVAYVNRIIEDANRQIKDIENSLRQICRRELQEFNDKIENGYSMVLEAALHNNVTKAEEGMNYILNIIGEKVVFNGMSRQEFCAQLFDK